MTTPWPAPDADAPKSHAQGSHAAGSHRPNYAVRRTLVGIGLAGIVAGAVFMVVSRRGDGTEGADSAVAHWNAVVAQDPASGTITVFDRDGAEVATVETDLIGLSDVGIAGTLLVGEQGDTSADGVGLLDLESGAIRALRLHTDLQPGTAGEAFRVGYDSSTKAIELLDAGRAQVVDLLRYTDAADPVVLPVSVRVDPEGDHVAFTELTKSETILVDLESSTAVSMPGTLIDMAFRSVVTLTNRGDTVLLDRYDLEGRRTGTVEVPMPAAVMLVDDTAAITVGRDGIVTQIDFAHESIAEVADLATAPPTESGAPVTAGDDPGDDGGDDPGDASAAPTEIVSSGIALLSHTRLAVFGDEFVAFVDADGVVVGRVATAAPVTPVGGLRVRHRCVLVAPVSRASNTLLDAETGTTIVSFDKGEAIGQSADGCTVAFKEVARDVIRLVGPGVDRDLDARVRGLSADATAALRIDTDGIAVIVLDSDDELVLTGGRGTAVFAVR
jgi:hypothetical protein